MYLGFQRIALAVVSWLAIARDEEDDIGAVFERGVEGRRVGCAVLTDWSGIYGAIELSRCMVSLAQSGKSCFRVRWSMRG